MNLFQAISDGEQISAMRIAFLIVVIAFAAVWATISIRTNTMQPIDWQQAAILITAFVAKAHQAGTENQVTKP